MEEILDGKWLRSGLVYLAMITWKRLRLSMLYLGGVIRFIFITLGLARLVLGRRLEL